MPPPSSHPRLVTGLLRLGAHPRAIRALPVVVLVSLPLFAVVAVATGIHSVPTFVTIVVIFCLLDASVLALGYLTVLVVLPARWLLGCVALNVLGILAAEASFAASLIVSSPLLPVTQALGMGTFVTTALAISYGLRWTAARTRAEAERGEGGVSGGIVRRAPAVPPRFWRLGARRHQQPPDDT